MRTNGINAEIKSKYEPQTTKADPKFRHFHILLVSNSMSKSLTRSGLSTLPTSSSIGNGHTLRL
jgi:hypothetical protein